VSQMKFKTRGMATPQGKPKVYFSSHPRDFQRFFQTISDSILEYVNCAVWYAEGEISDSAQHLEDLGQMQLFVVPISREFLTQPGFSRDVEIPFAIAHHIPVLPLLQEE